MLKRLFKVIAAPFIFMYYLILVFGGPILAPIYYIITGKNLFDYADMTNRVLGIDPDDYPIG